MIAITTLILVTFVLALSIVLRSVDIFRFYAFGPDTFGNLLYSNWLRDGSLNLYKVGKIVYPPLLPKLLYHLSNHFSLRALHLIPKIFDVSTSLMVFWFALWCSGNEFIAFLALVFYTFSPINVMNGWGIGTRNIGLFFFTLTLLASYVAISDANARCIMIILAVVSSILMMQTSRISYKSYYILVATTIILWPVNIMFSIILAIALLSIILCLLITRRAFTDNFKDQIFLIKFFRSRLGEKRKNEPLTKRVAAKLDVLKFDLWWVIGTLTFINAVSAHTLNETSLFLSTWLLAIVGLSFLWPWGEGERHIMLATVPGSILAATYLSEQTLLIIPLLILEISIIMARTNSLLKGRDLVAVDQLLLKVLNTMAEIIEENSLILCLPPVYSFTVAYYTRKKILYGYGASQEGILFQAEVLDSIATEEGLEELVTKYSVTHLFVDKGHSSLSISSNRWDIILQEGNFVVLRRKDQQKS